jgi:hypothetical protein
MTKMTALAGGQVVAARYELARPLAAGHDGATWLARDRHASRDVVLRFRAGDDVAGERIRAVVATNRSMSSSTSLAERSAACADVPGR